MTAMDKAVVLAAGRGTRIQRPHDSAGLDAQQSEVAQRPQGDDAGGPAVD